MSYQPNTIDFSKKPIIGYLPPTHSLLSKHFKRGHTKNDVRKQKLDLHNLKINLNFSKTLHTKKYSIIIITCLLALGLVTLGWVTQNRKLKVYQSNIAEISELERQASVLIQQNQEDLARQKLTLSLNKLNGLSIINNQSKDSYLGLKQSITTNLQTINHIKFIEEPTLFLNFQTILPKIDQLNISNIGLKGNVIYVTEKSQHKIYRLDLKKFLISEADGPSEQMEHISQILNTPNGLIFVNYQKGFFSYVPGQGFINLDASHLSEELSRTVSLAYFNENLYFLKPQSNQIEKYLFTEQPISDGQNWLNDEQTDLSNATSLSIDGDIYVTKSNGQILKLSNGKSVVFTTNIHPAIKTNSQIFTSPDHQYLYILEPTLYRLIVLDKSGNLITQFNSPKFNDLKSFYPDEANNIIYLLNGNQIYQIKKYLPTQNITE